MKPLQPRILSALILTAGMLASAAALAALTAAEAERLGKDLTPVGAERAGNKDGSIPAWDGGLTKPPAGWTPEQGYVDPFPNDKPRFTITAQNLDQYKDRLSPGLIELLKKYPNFKMPVYESRRTAAFPAHVYEKAKSQATKVTLDGNSIKNLGGSTVPFPIPRTGQEAIQNHTVRYQGGGFDRTYHWFPVRPNGDSYKVGFREYRVWDQNFDQSVENRMASFLAFFTNPPTLEGTIYLVHEPIDQVKESRQAWIYNAGQRRVRRAPDLAYDNVADGTEGIRVTDQYDAYNGALDRYEWKLIGKKEIYVPYNAYKLNDKKVKYSDIIQKNTINADLVRYEPHRVWVVEGTLRPNAKHIYGKRTFYLDEDSWSVLIEEAYDTRGNLWRVGVHPLIQTYDALVPFYSANVWHDLSNGNYLVAGLENEVKQPIKWGVKAKMSEFNPDALRRVGIR